MSDRSHDAPIVSDDWESAPLHGGESPPVDTEEYFVVAETGRPWGGYSRKERQTTRWKPIETVSKRPSTHHNAQPSFKVSVRDRRIRNTEIHCKNCGTTTKDCPSCNQRFQRAIEKGIDTAIVTDLLSLAWEGAYDVAILVTSDADFVPAVERVQERGLKVVNARWKGDGHNLAKACWASFTLDELAGQMIRDQQ